MSLSDVPTDAPRADLAASLDAVLPGRRRFAEGVVSLAGGVDPDGAGLFATRRFERDEVIGSLGGVLVRADRIDDYVRRHGFYGLQVHADWYVCPTGGAEIEEKGAINHSCEPNVGMADALTFVARRPIDANPEAPVELLIDYAMTGSPAGGFDGCRCGTSECRGRVTREDWRIARLQQRYGRYFPPFKLRRMGRDADVRCPLTRFLDAHGGDLAPIVEVGAGAAGSAG